MRKNVRYYTYAAIIIIVSGIYMCNLPQIAGTGNAESYTIKKFFPYFLMVLLCLFNMIKIATGTGNDLMKYGKLSEEEKQLYNISKIKKTQILYFFSLIIVSVFDFVFSKIYPNVILSAMFIVCYLVEIVVLFILAGTKWILNCFCRKK